MLRSMLLLTLLAQQARWKTENLQYFPKDIERPGAHPAHARVLTRARGAAVRTVTLAATASRSRACPAPWTRSQRRSRRGRCCA